MKHYLLKIVAIACLIFVTSCTSTKYLSIDILQPAKIDFAENIANIGVVDNAGIALSDSMTDVVHSPEELVTSKSKDVFLAALVQFIDEEKFFNQVTLYPKAMRTDKRYGLQLPMTKSTIQNIAKEIDVDAIVSLEAFETKNSEKMVGGNGWLFTAAQGNANIMFRIYDASGTAISPIMATSDSIMWAGETRGARNQMEYYQQLALQLSEGMTKLLIPYWETQERIYYTDGTNLMKTANKHVAKREWTDAAKVWGAAFEAEEKDTQKAKIAVNIALANENLGDIANAVEWIRIASNMMGGKTNSDEYNYISWYKVKLLERQQNNPKVLDQMGVEM